MNNPHRLYVEKLVLRSGANGVQIGCWSSEMLQIAGESGSRGLVLGTHTIGGGLSNREPGSYIYICIYIINSLIDDNYIYIYIHIS